MGGSLASKVPWLCPKRASFSDEDPPKGEFRSRRWFLGEKEGNALGEVGFPSGCLPKKKKQNSFA